MNPPSDGSVLTKTGGLYFKIIPPGSEIFVDGKINKKASLLFSDVFIKNLLPKTYNVKIQKDGYLSWEKNLEVKENLVTEGKNIVLLPQNSDIKTATDNVLKFFVSPDGTKIAYIKTNPDFKKSATNWYLSVLDINKNPEVFITDSSSISKAEFTDILWFPDSKTILLESFVGEVPKYFVFNTEAQAPTSSAPLTPVVLDALQNAEKIAFDWQNPSKIFYVRNQNLYYVDYKTKIVQGPIFSQTTTKILAYSIYKDSVFILDTKGFILVADLSGKIQSKINTQAFPVKKETGYELVMNFPEIFLKENYTLYYYNRQTDAFEKNISPISEISFSRDGKKMLIFNDNEIWVRYMVDILDQPQKKMGDLQLISRLSEKINNVFWLTDHYLIFDTNDKVKIAEIDDRDKLQVWDFITLENKNDSEMFWNGDNKTVYILNNSTVYSSDTLLK